MRFHLLATFPVLLLTAHGIAALRAVALPSGTTSLDDIGIYSVTYHYRDGRSGKMPDGWTGMFRYPTGISCTRYGMQHGKKCFLIHPPWKNGTGVTDQTFRLKLPVARKIELKFSIAMAEFVVRKSEGVTFRCFLNGKQLMAVHKKDANWSNYRFNLTPDAGRTINLRFQAGPGPSNNPSFDYGFWGNRRIIVTGAHAAPPNLPPVNAYPIPELCTPASQVTPGFALLKPVTGERSAKGRWWEIPVPSVHGAFYRIDTNHPLRVHVVFADDRAQRDFKLSSGVSITIVASHGSLIPDTDAGVKRSVKHLVLGKHTLRGILIYTFQREKISLHFTITAAGQGLAETFWADRPRIAQLTIGGITGAAFRRPVIVPYLGRVVYLPASGLFANSILDWTKSNATTYTHRHGNISAVYGALTNGKRNLLRETAYLAASSDIDAVLPNPPNPPSPFRKLLADKVILDVWSNHSFGENAAWLRVLASYQLTHFATIVHNWQHGGYDNELPSVLPALACLGGNKGLKEWVSTAVGLGELIGMHENYIDFYPNSPLFNPGDVALNSQGKPQLAWKNIIQSYALKPTDMLKFARRITTQVQHTFHENAGFIDVLSSAPPWFHVDMQAGEPGAGKLTTRWNANRKLWQLFRNAHHGPVFGEGANHWYWSGLLDGVEAQFGSGVPIFHGQTAPLFVDFDLLKIHPLQFNQGMGYLERWLRTGYTGNWESVIPTMKILDQYRMQEVAYGHAGFVPRQLWRSLPFVWQEENLMWPLTKRYATASAVKILYPLGHKMVTASTAIREGLGLDRVMVQYTDGLTIWANGRAAPWTIHLSDANRMIALPQYGWAAQAPKFLAGTWRRNGVISDVNRSPDRIFVDARSTVPRPNGIYKSEPNTQINRTKKVLDFSGIKTNGSVLLERRSANQWLLTPFPRGAPFTLMLSADTLGWPNAPISVESLNAANQPITQCKLSAANGCWYTIPVGQAGAAHYLLGEGIVPRRDRARQRSAP